MPAFIMRIFSERVAARFAIVVPSGAIIVCDIVSKIGPTTSGYISERILTTVTSSISFKIETALVGDSVA